jgi:hypothetical protein
VCFRNGLYEYAETYRARIRRNFNDGIIYTDPASLDLTISLIFLRQEDMDNFQSIILDICTPRGKRYRSGSGIELNNETTSRITCEEAILIRFLSSSYSQVDTSSPPCESVSNISQAVSSFTSVRITPDKQLKMIEKPNTVDLVGKNCDECHLKSQTTYPRDANKDGNIVYLSRNLHEHFDGINTEDKNIPSFLIQYVSHEEDRVSIVIDGQSFSKCKVVVHVCFRPLEKFLILANLLKDGSTRIDDYTYQTNLYFDNGKEAKKYLNFKSSQIKKTWDKFNGNVAQLLNGVEDE